MEKQTRRELLGAYKERKTVGGIYAIRNRKNGRLLVGSAADLKGFRNRFEFAKQTGSGLSLRLKRDWEAFGPDAFELEVLEELEKKDAQTAEEFSADLKALLELRLEGMDPGTLY